MSQQYDRGNNKQVDRSSTEIFRFPSREEMRKVKEQKQARIDEKNKPVVNNYKDEDLSGCLSGNLSGSLQTSRQLKSVVNNYKDEDLSGCLSGALNSQSTKLKTSHRDRFVPTERNLKNDKITSIEADDLSTAIDSLNGGEDEEKSGWLYFN